MTNEKLYEAICDINDNKILEAKKVKKVKQTIWFKWGAVAACLCLVVVSIIGIEIINTNKSYTAILNNGNQIIFNKGENSIVSPDMNIVGVRKLNETEANEIFGDNNVEATIGFEAKTNDFISLEGKIDNFNILVLRSDISPDLIIADDDDVNSLSSVNGVSVSAGYCLTEANSKGNKTAIAFASFDVGNYTIYLSTSGAENERDALCNELAEEIQIILETADLDFEIINQH
jgi:hypothetical protein